MACMIDMFEILCLSLLFVVVASSPANIFNVQSYGAKGDGKTDNANAFIKTWKNACAQSGTSTVYIPKGTFYVSGELFEGPCKGKIVFFIGGTLLAPVEPKEVNQDIWIDFRKVDNLVVSGDGTIDGQGSHSWRYNSMPRLPANTGFYFVRNSRISRLKSLNSKSEHLNLFNNVDHFNITGVNITAPGNSPNTDGIKIALSSNVEIWESSQLRSFPQNHAILLSCQSICDNVLSTPTGRQNAKACCS